MTRRGPGSAGDDHLQGGWRDASDLLVAVIPLALTVLLLISGFTPILRTLSDPNTTWSGFAYQAVLNKVTVYALACQTATVPAATLTRLRDEALSSLDNRGEYIDLNRTEQLGSARLNRAAALFRASEGAPVLSTRQNRLDLTIAELERLNEQSHERVHELQDRHALQLERLRLTLLLAAALSGLLSTALIWRALRLWRTERQRLDGQRELLSLASHELRRPLQSLLLATDLLRTAQTPEDRLRYLGVVESSAGQLASRANLDHLDTMYGDVHLDWQEVDLPRLLLEFQGPRTEVQVGPSPLPVRADPARLRQIIENLHENALRYSEGGVVVSLHLPRSPAASSSAVGLPVAVQPTRPEVHVRDSGPGIDLADADRLSPPAERRPSSPAQRQTQIQVQPNDSADRPPDAGLPRQGHGLGLTIARRLAQAHGADLTLSAAPGGGTLAVLRLAAPGAAVSLRPETTSQGRPKRLR